MSGVDITMECNQESSLVNDDMRDYMYGFSKTVHVSRAVSPASKSIDTRFNLSNINVNFSNYMMSS
jgi:hypothetical protein